MKTIDITDRFIRGIKKNEHIVDDVIKAFDESQKLIDYYQDEVKMSKLELKKALKDGNNFDASFIKGKIEAYTDHIEEVAGIIEALRGKYRDA